MTRRRFATTTPEPRGKPSIHDDRATLAYQPSLDGLRAVAVLGVMAFHAGLPWSQGGFLGVDIFFVLSGFLITTLLAREHASTGTIALGRFYMRRTLRLLPALLALVAVLHALSLWSSWSMFPDQLRQLRRETVATLAYVANWAQIAGIVSPLGVFGHTWSLAIEEQFYILWPLALRAMLGRLSRSAILAILAVGAAASAVLRSAMAGNPESFSRAFHGSDTRAEALLVGCFLAVWLQSPAALEFARRSTMTRLLAGVGVVVLLSLFTLGSWPSTWMLRSGITLAAVATALVLLELQAAPGGPLARALAWKPLAAIGSISYGLYLWHVPVNLTFAPMFFPIGAFWIAVVRFAATFAMATLSWLLVERYFLRWKRSWN